MKLLVIDLGSTSTKVALFEDEREVARKTVSHTRDELSAYQTLFDQLDLRSQIVSGFLEEAGCPAETLDCVASRGGSPPNVSTGATAVDERLVTALRERAKDGNPASLGPVIAQRIAGPLGIPAFIYDPITADELWPVAKVFGVKGIEHDSMGHMLNTHAMGLKVARQIARPIDELTLIIIHIGGGNTVSLWSRGHMVDVFSADAGAISSERCGFIRAERVIHLCEEYGSDTVLSWFRGKGGFVSLLGTNDLREVEQRIEGGDDRALLYEQAMAYQISKNIGALVAAAEGQVDGIVLTGGGAHWTRLTGDIQRRLAFTQIPFYLQPGENEMQALAEGACRAMRGEEEIHVYAG